MLRLLAERTLSLCLVRLSVGHLPPDTFPLKHFHSSLGITPSRPSVATFPFPKWDEEMSERGNVRVELSGCRRVRRFTYKMAAKTSWHRYTTKWRHCHPMHALRPEKNVHLLFRGYSVKNRVIWTVFGTQIPEEILHKRYVPCPQQLKNVTTIPCERQILCVWSNFHCFPQKLDAF